MARSNVPSTLLGIVVSYLRPFALRDTFGLCALVGYSYLLIRIPEYVKYVINDLEQGTNRAELWDACLVILGLAACSGLLLFCSRWLIIGASRKIEMQLRNNFFAHIQKLTPRFYQQIRTGDLVTRFSSDVEQARMLVGPGLMYPGQTILVTSLALYSMFRLDVELSLTLLIPISILLIYVNFNTRKLHRLYRQAQEIYSTLTAHVQENFNGIRVIKAYGQEEAEYDRFREINTRYVNKNIEQIKQRGKLFPFMRFIGGVGVVLILWRGGLQVINGELSLGALVQFAMYYQMLMWPIIALGWIINVIHRGSASWRRIHSILLTEPEIEDTASPAQISGIQGKIEVRHLTFCYLEYETPVLRDVSFAVHPGQTLGIIGPTGSGKSTLVNLLTHLYTVPRGTIFIDGMDINDIPLKTLREAIGYVSQEVFLFSETVRSNILFGLSESHELEDELIKKAAERAQIAKDLDYFPQGYETEIGERGITLSGGQKQRVGIARALILNRPILILDDSLSSVDADTEEAIFRGLQEEMADRTAIVISHRISTIKNADHIIVLDEGEIIEEGTHDYLIHNKGLYARIYRRQILEKSLGITV
ncbi:ATP-binding cassette domain-containing protein [bacterium]|nr:ATP-binding cassette domain-containing protein [bacterium]